MLDRGRLVLEVRTVDHLYLSHHTKSSRETGESHGKPGSANQHRCLSGSPRRNDKPKVEAEMESHHGNYRKAEGRPGMQHTVQSYVKG